MGPVQAEIVKGMKIQVAALRKKDREGSVRKLAHYNGKGNPQEHRLLLLVGVSRPDLIPESQNNHQS